MRTNPIVSRDEWLVARKTFLAEEKAHTRASDALHQKRRELPWVKVEKHYDLTPKGRNETVDGMDLLRHHDRYGRDDELVGITRGADARA